MKTATRTNLIRQKISLKPYLKELALLMGRPVLATELGDLEQAAALRELAQQFAILQSKIYKIKFPERESVRFQQFIEGLYKANPSGVHIWTKNTIDCGALFVPSVRSIKFNFPFDAIQGDILVLTTSDSKDKLLVDLFIAPNGDQMLSLEVKGENWTDVIY